MKVEKSEVAASEDRGCVQVAAFYAFTPVEDPGALVRDLERRYGEASPVLRGTVLVATEGINATLSGERDALEHFVRAAERALGVVLDVKWSEASRHPFRRLRIRERKEIVTFAQREATPIERAARHVDAATWREYVARDDVLVLDVRNEYEIHAGRFRGAVSPHTESFTEFADFVERELTGDKGRTIAMYCTGGIRCEKASSYLLAHGFADVAQLHGGVLGYLEARAQSEGGDEPWQGECFVFDERVTVDRELRPGSAVLCDGCGWPILSGEQRCANCGSVLRDS